MDSRILTFIITDRADREFVEYIYSSDNIMEYGNGVVIHEPKILITILNHAKDDLQFRVLIHLGATDHPRGNPKGYSFYNTLKDELGIESMGIITREASKFPKDELSITHNGYTIYNTNRINNRPFIDGLKVFTKSDLNIFKSEKAPSAIQKQTKSVDYVIITALFYDEMEKIKDVFKIDETSKISIGKHKGYQFTFNDKNIIALSQSEMGMVEAGILTTKMIKDYHPRYVIMPGVCGGDQKTNFGDIVISKKINLFQTGKETDNGFERDNISEDIDIEFIEELKHQIKITEGDQIKGIVPEIETILRTTRTYKTEFEGLIGDIDFHIEPTACSSSVINKKGYFEDVIKKIDRKMIAIEMEGYGVARAVKLLKCNTKAVLVKCVMDKTKDKDAETGNITPDKRKSYAALVSALFVKKMIEKDVLK